MSSFREGEGGPDPGEEAQLLYQELATMHQRLGGQLLALVDDELTESVTERLASGEVALELINDRLQLPEIVAGADAVEPARLARKRFVVLDMAMFTGGEHTDIPQYFDPPPPYSYQPLNAAFVAVGVEGRPFIGSTEDLDNIAMQRQVAELQPFSGFNLAEVEPYYELLTSQGGDPRLLSERDCHALRQIVPLLELNEGDTFRENHLR